MKYIKPHMIFESSQREIIQDVKDICLELQDDRFLIDCELVRSRMSDKPIFPREEQTYDISIKKTMEIDINDFDEIPKSLIKWVEIREVILRIIDYTHQNHCKIRFFYDGSEVELDTLTKHYKDFEKNYAFFQFRILITIP